MTERQIRTRPVLLAPFGQYTRYVLRSHLRHTVVILAALLCVAFIVDLPPQIEKLLAGASGPGARTLRLLWFMALRGADLLPRFIPLAAFLGVVWTQVALALSRERILVWNTGRSMLQSLVPVLLLAVALGAVQYGLDAYLRPAAMGAQIRQKLGTYGDAFDRGLSKDFQWIALGDNLLHARIAFGPPAVLHDMTLYRLNAKGRLREVDNARTATAMGDGNWLLRGGSYWSIPAENASGTASVALFTRGTGATATYFEERPVPLAAADPLWLSLWGIYPQYLSQDTLQALAHSPVPADRRDSYIAHLQFNRANALMPGAMALLAEMLCLMLFAHGVPLHLQLATLPAGYAAHLAMKTLFMMGEHDYLSPVAGPWATPVSLLLLSGALLGVMEGRRRKGGRLAWSDAAAAWRFAVSRLRGTDAHAAPGRRPGRFRKYRHRPGPE
jgi:lipopolysaccharide export system permease protein